MPEVNSAFIWWVVPKVLCSGYLVSFLSLRNQILPWIGSQGISPARLRMKAMSTHFPGWRAFFYKPTLLWINDSDRFLVFIVWLGIVASAAGVLGGFWWACLVAWVCYLSLADASLIYPWDCLLLEAGFLALFSPSVALVVIAWKLLLLRVIWGFARKKFVGGSKNNMLYLRGFLTWMPLPNPLGWWLQKAPNALLISLYIFMFVAEVIAPTFVFFPGDLRWIAFAGLATLMVAIASTGNWGFFNWLYLGLSVIVLDSSWPALNFDANPLTNIVMVLLIVGGLFHALGSSWTTGCIMFVMYEKLKHHRILKAILGLYSTLVPFRLLHSYGVFPADSIPAIRHVVVFEGSNDGVTWKPYEYRYAPSQPNSAPKFVAPHHPRLDHLTCYAGFGATFSDFFTAVAAFVPCNDFLGHSPYSWVRLVMQRLLEGNGQVVSLFRNNPFAAAPPRFMRLATYFLTPASIKELLTTGSYWTREFASVAIRPQVSNPEIYRHHIAPPELLHPMQSYWKRRTPELKKMLNFTCSLRDAVLIDGEITGEQVHRFWEDYVPSLQKYRHGNWDLLEADASAFEQRFRLTERHLFERVLARYTYLLFSRYESLHEHKYHLQLLFQEFVLDGYDAFEATYKTQNSQSVAERMERTSASALLYLLAVMKFEEVRTFTIFMHATVWIKGGDKTLDPFFKALLAQKVFANEITIPCSDAFRVAFADIIAGTRPRDLPLPKCSRR